MFTGLIEEVGIIERKSQNGGKTFFTIRCFHILKDSKIGSSVACDGICLTVTKINNNSIEVQVMNETLLKTTATYWERGRKINLERAMQANGRMDGHFVLGHIDTIAMIKSRGYERNTLYVEFDLDEKFYPLVIAQGSIAVNGISLTVARLTDYTFSVAFIGHTLENTNIKDSKTYVNLEFDVVGKYIQRNLERYEDKGHDQDWLEDNGF